MQLAMVKSQEVEEEETDHKALMDGYVRNIHWNKNMLLCFFTDM